MMEDKKRINLELPEDLRRAFQLATFKQGKKMSAVIREFIENYVKENR